jgi:DNA polymerase-3 subunit gamma/tau
VIPTIISRCQRYDFKRIPIDSIVKRLKDLAAEEEIEIDSESLYLIARKADGGLRDALSLLDQVLSYCQKEVTIDKVRDIFGLIPNQVYCNLLRHISDKDSVTLLNELHSIFEHGTDLQELLANMMEFLRIVILRKLGLEPADVNRDEYPVYDGIASLFTQNNLIYLMNYLMQSKVEIKGSANPYLVLEMVMIKLCKMDEMEDISSLIASLAALPAGQAIQKQQVQPPRPLPEARPALVQPETAIQGKLEFNLENLRANWDKIITRIKRGSTVTGIGLASHAKIKSAEGNKLILSVEGSTNHKNLLTKKEEIQDHLADFFTTPVRLELELIETAAPTKVEIARKTLEDLKNLDSAIARYIEITDSKLISGS